MPVLGSAKFPAVHGSRSDETTPSSVTHKVVLCDESEKREHLREFLEYCILPGDKTVIILCKRDRVEYLTGDLTLGGFKYATASTNAWRLLTGSEHSMIFGEAQYQS